MLHKLLAVFFSVRASLSARGRLAALVCAPVLAGAVALVVWTIATRRWALLVLFCYAAMSLMVLIQSLVGDDAGKAMPVSLDALNEDMWFQKGKLQLFLYRVRTWAIALSSSLSWPATLALVVRALYRLREPLRQRGYITLQERIRLNAELLFPVQYFLSALVTCLSTLIAFTAFQVLHVHSRYGLWLMFTFVLAVLVRQLTSLLFKGGVLGLFKQTEGVPVLNFLAVLFFDLTTIVLALSCAGAMRHQKTVSPAEVQTTAVMLITLNKVLAKALGGGVHQAVEYLRGQSRSQLASIAIGLTTYVVLLRTSISILSVYKRDDDDHIAVAIVHIQKGEFDKAEKQLVEVVRHTPMSQHLRVRTLLSLGNLLKAEECTVDALKADFTNKEVVGVNEVYFSMLVDSFGVSPEAKMEWWKAAVAREVSGAVLFLMLMENAGDDPFIAGAVRYPGNPSTALAFGAYCVFARASGDDGMSWLQMGSPLLHEEQFVYSAAYVIAEILLQTRATWTPVLEEWFSTSFEHFKRMEEELSGSRSFWKCLTALTVTSYLAALLRVVECDRAIEIEELAALAKSRMEQLGNGRALANMFAQRLSDNPPWRIVPPPAAEPAGEIAMQASAG